MNDEWLLTLAACPACRGPISSVAPDSGLVTCGRCSLEFATTRGVPRLLDTRDDRYGDGESTPLHYADPEFQRLASDAARMHVEALSYYDFVAFLGDDNLPPGGPNALAEMLAMATRPGVGPSLDIGSNTGYVTRAVARATGQLTVGLDYTFPMCVAARLRGSSTVTRYVCGDATAMPFRDGVFQFAISGGSIAFTSRPHLAYSEIHRVLAHGGTFLDLEFVCREEPPPDHVGRLRAALGTDIEFRSEADWLSEMSKGGFSSVTSRQLTRREEFTPMLIGYEDAPRVEPMRSIVAKMAAYIGLFQVNRQYITPHAFIATKVA